MIKKLALIVFAATVLVGCTQNNTSVDINQPNTASTPTTQGSGTFTNESSGDVDQDIEDIEEAIDSLDVDEDFPTFDADSI